MNFIYSQIEHEIKGQFLIPNFKEVVYKKAYDPLTMLVTKIEPLYVYPAIRTGKWIYKDKNGESTMTYQPTIVQVNPDGFCK